MRDLGQERGVVEAERMRRVVTLHADRPVVGRACRAHGFRLGVEMSAVGARMVFIPGAASVTATMRERMARADVVFFDGTLYRDDEMIAALSAKTRTVASGVRERRFIG